MADINPAAKLPNETTVLVLGILSIPLCCCYNAGLILAIIALVLASKDLKLYRANPGQYDLKSIKNLNTGKICAIIGLVINCVSLLSTIWWISMFGWASLTNMEEMRQILEQMQNQ